MTEPQNVSGLMDQIYDLKAQLADAERRGAVRALRKVCLGCCNHDYAWIQGQANAIEAGRVTL